MGYACWGASAGPGVAFLGWAAGRAGESRFSSRRQHQRPAAVSLPPATMDHVFSILMYHLSDFRIKME